MQSFKFLIYNPTRVAVSRWSLIWDGWTWVEFFLMCNDVNMIDIQQKLYPQSWIVISLLGSGYTVQDSDNAGKPDISPEITMGRKPHPIGEADVCCVSIFKIG